MSLFRILNRKIWRRIDRDQQAAIVRESYFLHGDFAIEHHSSKASQLEHAKPGIAWMSADPDRAKAKRVTDAMLKMVKIDVAKLQAAHEAAKV